MRGTLLAAVLTAIVVIGAAGTAYGIDGTIQGTAHLGNGNVAGTGTGYVYVWKKVSGTWVAQNILSPIPRDAAGHWTTSTPPGDYRLSMTCNLLGWASGNWTHSGFVPGPMDSALVETITVAGGDTHTCDATFPVAASIDGTVAFHATGLPVTTNTNIPLYFKDPTTGTWFPFAAFLGTNGRCWLTNLLPGWQYRVGVTGFGPYGTRFWNDAPDVESATTMLLAPGQTQWVTVPMRVNVSAETIAGSDRVKTAIAASQRVYGDGDEIPGAVIVCTGYNWPDALGGAALAGTVKAPILLTPPTSMPAHLVAEVQRLHANGASRAYILGSSSAVATAVETQLEGVFGKPNVTRLGGSNRYATATRVATTTASALGAGFSHTFFIASGTNYPDALAAAPVAAKLGWPVLLAEPDGHGGLSNGMTALVASMGTHAVMLGSESAVPSGVATDLANALGGWSHVERWAGANRVATSVEIGKHAVNEHGMDWNGLGFANAYNYPDALCAAPVLGYFSTVLLLTPDSTSIPTSLTAQLNSLAASATPNNGTAPLNWIRYFGGDPALHPATKAKLLDVSQ